MIFVIGMIIMMRINHSLDNYCGLITHRTMKKIDKKLNQSNHKNQINHSLDEW